MKQTDCFLIIVTDVNFEIIPEPEIDFSGILCSRKILITSFKRLEVNKLECLIMELRVSLFLRDMDIVKSVLN